MEQLGGEHIGRPVAMRKVVAASVVGTIIEWYDFFLYGAAAAVVFNQLFFPEFAPLAGTLAAFATYALGFFVRPLGGIIFGHFGDKIGRKPVLVMTLLLMGVSTALVGILPTYGAIGIWAPVLLLVLRMLQGLGAGAEYGGAILMSSEHAIRRRGFYASWAPAGVFMGNLLAAGVFGLFSTLPEEQFLAWGWRVPFLLSIIVVAIGMYIRMRILETPEFTSQVKEGGREARIPILSLLRSKPKEVLIAMGVNVSLNGYTYIPQVFVLTYVTLVLGLSKGAAFTGVMIGYAVGILFIVASGALSDRLGRRPVIMAGAALCVLLAFPFWWLIDTGVPVLMWLAIILTLSIAGSAIFGAQPAFYTELFDPRVRYSGIVLARETTGALVGGPTPFIATALIGWSGGEPWPVAVYMLVIALITLIAIYLAPETLRGDTSRDRTQERSIVADETV